MTKSFKWGFLILNIIASIVLALSFFIGVENPESQAIVLICVVSGMFLSGLLIGTGV